MLKTRKTLFGELRRLLRELGFKEKPAPAALVFQHPAEGLLVFRRYKADEPVDENDLVSTRKFLDYRGLQESRAFDAFLHTATKPAS